MVIRSTVGGAGAGVEGVLRGVDAARMTDDFFELLAGFTYSAGSGATGNVSSRLESFISRK